MSLLFYGLLQAILFLQVLSQPLSCVGCGDDRSVLAENTSGVSSYSLPDDQSTPEGTFEPTTEVPTTEAPTTEAPTSLPLPPITQPPTFPPTLPPLRLLLLRLLLLNHLLLRPLPPNLLQLSHPPLILPLLLPLAQPLLSFRKVLSMLLCPLSVATRRLATKPTSASAWIPMLNGSSSNPPALHPLPPLERYSFPSESDSTALSSHRTAASFSLSVPFFPTFSVFIRNM